MIEYMGFWLAKIVVEMAVAVVLIVILFSIFFIYVWLSRKAQKK